MNLYIYFIIIQLVNVILSTIKTLVVTKGNRTQAVIVSGIYYGFYAFVIRMVASDNLNVAIVGLITMFVNFIGVYISFTILDKLKKDKLWLMKLTVQKEETSKLKDKLVENKIKFLSLTSDWDEVDAIEIYSYTKEETNIIKNILSQFNTIKSCVIETTKSNII